MSFSVLWSHGWWQKNPPHTHAHTHTHKSLSIKTQRCFRLGFPNIIYDLWPILTDLESYHVLTEYVKIHQDSCFFKEAFGSKCFGTLPKHMEIAGILQCCSCSSLCSITPLLMILPPLLQPLLLLSPMPVIPVRFSPRVRCIDATKNLEKWGFD